MIALVASLAFALQAADVPSELVIRAGDRTGTVAVVSTRLGPMLSAQQLLAPMGATLRQDAADRWRFIVAGSELQLTLGMRVVRSGNRTESLAAPPTMAGGVLYLPLSLVTDVIPRVVSGFVYDAAAAELRRFTPVVSRRPVIDSPVVRGADEPPARRAPVESSAASLRAPPTVRPAPTRPQRPRVVVDAGHGGVDRGMRGPIGVPRKVYEADITLAIAQRLRDELQSRGVDVVMTRSTDTLIALDDRGRIANRSRGDVFLSVHVNAANPRWRDPGAARGFETYFLAEAKSEDERRVADVENEAVKYEVEADGSTRSGDPLSFILNDMKQNEYLRESSELASTIQAGLRRVHPAPSRGVKQAGFRVLVGAFMPAVLIEVGFGTNPSDANYMTSTRGRSDLAAAIADATMAYLARYGQRRGGGTTGGAR